MARDAPWWVCCWTEQKKGEGERVEDGGSYGWRFRRERRDMEMMMRLAGELKVEDEKMKEGQLFCLGNEEREKS